MTKSFESLDTKPSKASKPMWTLHDLEDHHHVSTLQTKDLWWKNNVYFNLGAHVVHHRQIPKSVPCVLYMQPNK